MKNFDYIIKSTFEKINFQEKYRNLLNSFSDYENSMEKIDIKQIKMILKENKLFFKVFNPGQEFYHKESIFDFEFSFNFKTKYGAVTSYIFIWFKGNKIEFEYPNLNFVYKWLEGKMEEPISPPSFKTYDDFRTIIISLNNIFEDFITEFLKQVKEKDMV